MTVGLAGIRAAVVQRLIARSGLMGYLVDARDKLAQSTDLAIGAQRPASLSVVDSISGLRALSDVVLSNLNEEMRLDLDQLGFLIARDVIAPVARESVEPVAWLTGNSMMPPLREVDDCDVVWGFNQPDGEWWSLLVEAIDNKLAQEQVYMAAPEYDNSLYVVDLKRWESACDEAIADAANINDEWQAKTS